MADRTVRLAVRWLLRDDLPAVMAVEREVYDRPWTARQMVGILKSRRVNALVADAGGKVAGFLVWRGTRDGVELLDLAVAFRYQRKGVASRLLQRLQKRVANLSPRGAKQVSATVPDDNLAAHLLLRSLGFRAVRVHRRLYEEDGDDRSDGYEFLWEV